MQRKLIHGFLAALLMVMQLCTLVGIRHVQAVESPTVQETLIDSNDLKLEVSGVQNGQTVDWTVKYERKVSTNARALKLNVKAADTLLAPKDAKTWQELQATNTKWWQEKDFTTKSSGILRYQTSIDQLSLTITAQLDEQQPVVKAVTSAESETAEAQAVEATKTPTVTADLLDAKVAGPHTITLVLPESEVDEPVPDPEDEAAQDQATSESVVADTLPSAPVEDEKTETSAEEEPVAVEDDDSEEVTTEEEANTETAEAPADEPKTKAAGDKVIDPDTTLPQVQATNLVLQRYQFSKLAIESETGDIVFKAPSGTQNYDSEQNMRDFTSKNYTEGSSSGAVIFSQSDGLNATIDLSYDDVGLVQLTNGTSVRIGARVTVSKLTYRNSDWGNSTKMAMDFSNNFYSGLQLANIRQFDWKVTFFVKDTKAVVNFTDASTAMLTFTSLNPGEFVKPPAGLVFSTADPTSVMLTNLGSNTNPPTNYDDYQDWLTAWNTGWNRPGTITMRDAYTSRQWGEWDDDDFDASKPMWQDKLGAPTFANGAAAFTLVGSTFTFTRGTYFLGNTTWLANASSDPIFTIPDYITNNKSISKDAVEGGGTAQDIEDATNDTRSWTPNDLDGKSINAQAATGSPMYYYINQQTYSLSGELLAYPDTITITDDLPIGMTFFSDSDADVVVFNERKAGDTKGTVLEGAKIKRTGQNLTVTLPPEIMADIPFDGGYLTIRIKVKTTHDPNTITQAFQMDNKAHVTIQGPKGSKPWDKWTNEVSVHVSPNVNAEFKKVDADNQPLQGAEFKLYDNAEATGEAKYTATSDVDGKVAFANVIPGTYWLKETSTPPGYKPLSQTIAITINADGTIKWPADWKHGNQVVNEKTPWLIEINKVDAEDNPLSGAEFTLYDEDDQPVAAATTAADGVIRFSDLDLAWGKEYRLTETKAPLGFKPIKENFKFVPQAGTVTVVGDPDAYKPWTATFDPSLITLSLKVTNHEDDPVDLPVTGGNGTQAIIAASIVIMMMASMLGWHWRKEAHR